MKVKILIGFLFISFCGQASDEIILESIEASTSTTTLITVQSTSSTTSTTILADECEPDNNQNIDFTNIRNLQIFLNKYGFNPGPSDGYLGNKTINAIKDFQNLVGLTADGDAGEKTIYIMNQWTGCEENPKKYIANLPASSSESNQSNNDNQEDSTTSSTTTTTTVIVQETKTNNDNLDVYGLSPTVSITNNQILTVFAGLNSAGSFCGVPYYSSLTNQSVNYLENGNLDIKTILNGHYSLSSSSSSITDIRSGEIEIKVQGNGDENYNFYFIAPYTSDLILLSPKSIVVNPGLTTAVFDISELKSGYWFYSFAENASGEIVKSSGLREFLVGNEVTQSASAHTKVEKIFITLNNKKVLAGQSISNQEALSISYLTDGSLDNRLNLETSIEINQNEITLKNAQQANTGDLILIGNELLYVTEKNDNVFKVERGYLGTEVYLHEVNASVKVIENLNSNNLSSSFGYAVFRHETGFKFQIPLYKELNKNSYDLTNCPAGRYFLESINTYNWRSKNSSSVNLVSQQNLNGSLFNYEFVIENQNHSIYLPPQIKSIDDETGKFLNDGPRSAVVSRGDKVDFNFSGLASGSSDIQFMEVRFKMLPSENSGKQTTARSVFVTSNNGSYAFTINIDQVTNSRSVNKDHWESGYKYVFDYIKVYDEYTSTAFYSNLDIVYDYTLLKGNHDSYYLDQFIFIVNN